MKKVVLMFITAIVMMCSFSSCAFLPFNWDGASSSESSVEDIKGSSPDNPVPLGEYGQIGREVANGQQDVRMKIIEVLTPEETKEEYGALGLSGCYLVKIQIEAIDLKESGYHCTYTTGYEFKNGASGPSYLIDYRLRSKLLQLMDVSFNKEGTVECYDIFEYDFNDCECLYYAVDLDKVVYFSLR